MSSSLTPEAEALRAALEAAAPEEIAAVLARLKADRPDLAQKLAETLRSQR